MASGFAVTVEAIDKATASIDKINKKFASMSAPVVRLNKSLAKFSDVSGITKMTAGVTKLGSGMVHLAKSTAGVVAPLSAISSAASVAGLIALTEKFGEFGSQVRFASQNIGISVDSLSALQGAAALAGSSSSALTSGMLNLSTAITDAAGGRNMEALGYFKQLGINIRGANGALRTADQVLPDVADGIAKISNPALQRRVAAAFGLSDDLLPFLRRGAAGMREYQAEARRYGAINEAGAAASEALRLAQARLTLSVEGLGYSVAEKLAPVLMPMLTDLANWVAAHRTDIADVVAGIAKQFDLWVKNGGVEKTTAAITEMATAIDNTVKQLGGWKTAAEILGGVLLLRVLAPLASILSVLGRLAIATPAWLSLPLLLKGDTADNPEANDAMRKTVDAQVADYKRRHNIAPNGMRSEAAWDGVEASKTPRGIRNNNPLNLEYRDGQGASSSDGRFGKYATMRDGVAAATRQLLIDQDRGQNTLRKLIADPVHGWAPAKDGNDTEGYIRDLSKRTGFGADDRLNLRDPDQAQRVIYAMSHHENGRDIDGRDIQSGVDQALTGPYSGAPAGAPGATGSVKVEIVHRNAPPGTSMTATSSGNVKTAARVESSSLLAPN